MKLGPPIPWSDVKIGDVVLLWGTPRTVMAIAPDTNFVVTLYFEGMPASVAFTSDQRTHRVELDAGDAIANLHGAGLNPRIIEE